MNRRKLNRITSRVEVGLLGDLVDAMGTVVDLSTTGCRVQGADRINAKGNLHLMIRSQRGQAPIKVEQAAIRWTAGQGAGLEFVRVHPEQARRLSHLVSVLKLTPGLVRAERDDAGQSGGWSSAATPRRQESQSSEDLLDKLYDRWG